MHELAAVLCMLGAAGAIMALAFGPRPCTCTECALHTQERAARLARQRAFDHQYLHQFAKMEWNDPQCTACRNGGDRDKMVR